MTTINLTSDNSSSKPVLFSFFHGVGGMVIGAEKAGFEHVYATDFWHAAEKFHEQNNKNGLFQLADFRKLKITDIEDHFESNHVAFPKEIDLVMAGTPCPGWSKVNRN